MELSLYPPQQTSRDALVEALQSQGAALDSSDMGTGKTLKAVEVAKTMHLTPLVVCPKTVVGDWRRTLVGQGCSPHDVVTWETIRRGSTSYLSRRGKKGFDWKVAKESSLLIFDEVHKAKGIKTLNANMLIAAKRQGYKILMLSATAAEDPREMRAIGFALNLHSLKNFWNWAQDWGCFFDTFNSLQFPSSAQHRLIELNKLIYPSRGHKLFKEDLGDRFQECRIIQDPIQFTNQKAIENLMEELEPELEILENRREADGDDALAITKILRLRQEIELLKVPEIVDMIHEGREAGNSMAVFLNFTETINAISRRVKEKHIFIQGGQTEKERRNSIDAFQKNEVRVALVNIAAGGVGTSLHDTDGKFPRMALISPTYNAKDFHQTLGRIDRLGGMSESVQRILVADKTIEEKIVSRMMEKIENISLLHAQNDVSNTTMSNSTPSTPSIQEEDAEHAEYSPSSLKYVASCPGYKPEESTNEAAEMGTRIHNALETGDWSKLKNDYENSLTQGCRNAEDAIFRLHGITRLVHEVTDFKEIRLTMKLIDHTTFGTCDRLVLMDNPEEAVQIDYKTGLGKIDEPLNNWQSKAYTVGAFQKFPQLKKITFYFIACRRDEILSGEFSRDDVPQLIEELSGVIRNAKEVRSCFDSIDSALLSPQALVCNYCENSGRCPAVAKMAVDVARKYAPGDSKIEALPEMHGSNITDPEVMRELLDIAPILKKAVSGWEHRGRQMALEEGIEIPGYEVQERSGRRSITSALAAYGVIKDIVDIEDFLDGIDSFPVTKYEKLIASKAPRGGKKERVAEAMAELSKLGAIKKTSGSKYLSKSKK